SGRRRVTPSESFRRQPLCGGKDTERRGNHDQFDNPRPRLSGGAELEANPVRVSLLIGEQPRPGNLRPHACPHHPAVASTIASSSSGRSGPWLTLTVSSSETARR